MKVLSRLGSLIEVRQSWGGKTLYIDGHPQSQRCYRRDWNTIFKKSGVREISDGASVLMLGLGGGDVIKLLTHLQPKVTITAVELESEVVQVARDYFGVHESDKVKIVVADAQDHMRINKLKYDLVIVDLYSGDDVPKFVSGKQFLLQLARVVKSKGLAIINYASHSFREGDFDRFESKLRRIFGSVKRIKTWGHTYFVACA